MRRSPLLLLLLLAACKDPLAEPAGDFTAGDPQLLSIGNPTKDEDPSVLLARDGRIYVAWFSEVAGNSDIYVKSTADGKTWSSPVRVTTSPGGDFNPSLIQDDQGTFHLAWFRWTAPFLGNIWVSSSADGLAWTPEVQATKAFQVDDWVPTIAKAPDGTLLVYFVSQKRSGGTPDLYLAARRPGAADFDPVVPLATLNSATSADHLPFAARTPDGITLVWVRYDPATAAPWEAKKSDLWLATSPDGRTWPTPTKVTNESGNVVNLFPALYESAPGKWALNWLSSRSGDAKPVELTLSGLAGYPSGLLKDPLPDGYSHKISRTPRTGAWIGLWVQGAEGAQDVWYKVFER